MIYSQNVPMANSILQIKQWWQEKKKKEECRAVTVLHCHFGPIPPRKTELHADFMQEGVRQHRHRDPFKKKKLRRASNIVADIVTDVTQHHLSSRTRDMCHWFCKGKK